MRLSASDRAASFTDLVPVDRDEFIDTITPCLQLVAPVGMSHEAQDAWFEAAWVALDGIPIGLLQRGCRAAMRTADHHSKIVPAIMQEIGAAWENRRRLATSATERPRALPPAVDPKAEEERREVGKLMRNLVKRLEAGHAEN